MESVNPPGTPRFGGRTHHNPDLMSIHCQQLPPNKRAALSTARDAVWNWGRKVQTRCGAWLVPPAGRQTDRLDRCGAWLVPPADVWGCSREIQFHTTCEAALAAPDLSMSILNPKP
jgi:hypothetical protein